MIDTHSHIYLEQFSSDRQALLQRAKDAGVEAIYLPNIDRDSIGPLKALNDAHPQLYPMMGLHPSHVKADHREQLAAIFEELDSDYPYVAVGEIGMDLYWDQTYVAEQKEAFALQIEKAKARALPIVIHCREAFDETFAVLEAYADKDLKGIFHCFTGNREQAQRAIDLNFKLGIGGVVTFKNAGLDKVVADLALEHLVLETDAPYLAPLPFRGKRNEPSYLVQVRDKIAALHGCTPETVSEQTNRNAQWVFGR